MIEREIQEKLLKLFKRKEILALVGARQVGKTTLMNFLYNKIEENESKNFISFDEFENLSLFENDLNSFIEIHIKPYKYLFIDEFQYAKDGGKKLKRIYDTFSTLKVKFNIKIVISCSSVPELSIHSLQYLVGRVLILNINHLSFGEYIKFKNEGLYNAYKIGFKKESFDLVRNYFEEFLIYGSYPAVVLESDLDLKKEILSSLINTYLLKEVRDIMAYKSSFEFEKVLELLSINLGIMLNKSNLSNDIGISRYKIDEILSSLNKTFIIEILKPLTSTKIKELVKSPKIYFFDTGFRNYLIKNFNRLKIRYDKGYLYENFVLNEMSKSGFKPQFYNYKNGSEIDFVINHSGKTIGFEVKSKLNNLNVTKSLSGFIKRVKPDIIYILNENLEDEIIIENTKIKFTYIININSILKKEFEKQ